VLEKSIAGPATVSGNRQLLFQAIGNLIDNASKYGAAGGRISLSVQNGNGGPEVVVADRGPGIPAADRERVLERFVRLDSSRTTPGNGLGLSLVAAIARLHNAVLNLDDNGPGLKVTLRFRPAAI
jgi:signal transduction histidine kinase